MPRGPQGQKRPADVNACAVKVMKIATGEIEEDIPSEAHRRAGLNGAAARADKLTPEERSASARKAAKARWE